MSDKAREERLKAALRENLKKRKAQARSRAAGAPGGGDETTSGAGDESGGAATPPQKGDA
jgi:hypothetical protein